MRLLSQPGSLFSTLALLAIPLLPARAAPQNAPSSPSPSPTPTPGAVPSSLSLIGHCIYACPLLNVNGQGLLPWESDLPPFDPTPFSIFSCSYKVDANESSSMHRCHYYKDDGTFAFGTAETLCPMLAPECYKLQVNTYPKKPPVQKEQLPWITLKQSW